MGRKRSLDFEDEDEEQVTKPVKAKAKKDDSGEDSDNELFEVVEEVQSKAKNKVTSTKVTPLKPAAVEETVITKPLVKKAALEKSPASEWIPEVRMDYELPVVVKRKGKWTELAQELISGEAVTNLPTRQAAAGLKQALKSQGKASKLAALPDGNFAVKVL